MGDRYNGRRYELEIVDASLANNRSVLYEDCRPRDIVTIIPMLSTSVPGNPTDLAVLQVKDHIDRSVSATRIGR